MLSRSATGSSQLTLPFQMTLKIILKLLISRGTESMKVIENISHLRLSVPTPVNIKESLLIAKQN